MIEVIVDIATSTEEVKVDIDPHYEDEVGDDIGDVVPTEILVGDKEAQEPTPEQPAAKVEEHKEPNQPVKPNEYKIVIVILCVNNITHL